MFKLTLTLLFALSLCKDIVFTRHGQRTPTKFNEFKQKRWAGYQAGDLTEVGVQFLMHKGMHLVKFLDIHDANGNCIAERMSIISSPKQRTIMSTFALIRGMCPLNYKQIADTFITNYLQPIATNTSDVDFLLQHSMENIFELSNYTRSFHIEDDNLFHGQDSDECPLVDVEFQKILNSTDYATWNKFFKDHPTFASILEYIKVRNADDVLKNPDLYTVQNYPLKKVKAFFGDYKCEWAQGMDVEKLTEEEYYLLTQIAIFVFYDLQNGSDELNKAALSEIFKWVKAQLQDTQYHFHWFSAHDTNQVAILDVLIHRQERDRLGYLALPPFGSELILKVVDGKVRVLYNGDHLRTNVCEHGYECHLEEFQRFLDSFIVEDVESYCKI